MLSFARLLALAPAVSLAYGAVFDVDVGEDALVFKPNSVKAAVGDTVNFHFYPGDHSVAQSLYGKPCMPSGSDAVYSGFFTQSSGVAKMMFQVTVNSTQPLWMYCSNSFHCSAGMSMVINPPASGDTLAAYQTASKKIFTAKSPTKVQGGALVPNKEGGAAPAPAPVKSSKPPATSKQIKTTAFTRPTTAFTRPTPTKTPKSPASNTSKPAASKSTSKAMTASGGASSSMGSGASSSMGAGGKSSSMGSGGKSSSMGSGGKSSSMSSGAKPSGSVSPPPSGPSPTPTPFGPPEGTTVTAPSGSSKTGIAATAALLAGALFFLMLV